MTRREELTEAAADYVLDHGLIGLSLRPLAAALGTSDRMLLYHFADKDDLVATVFRAAVDRGVAELRGLPRRRGRTPLRAPALGGVPAGQARAVPPALRRGRGPRPARPAAVRRRRPRDQRAVGRGGRREPPGRRLPGPTGSAGRRTSSTRPSWASSSTCRSTAARPTCGAVSRTSPTPSPPSPARPDVTPRSPGAARYDVGSVREAVDVAGAGHDEAVLEQARQAALALRRRRPRPRRAG